MSKVCGDQPKRSTQSSARTLPILSLVVSALLVPFEVWITSYRMNTGHWIWLFTINFGASVIIRAVYRKGWNAKEEVIEKEEV